MPVVAGDAYIASLATYVQTNSTRLAAAAQSSRGGLRKQASTSYLTTALTLGLAGPSAPPKPLTLRITPQNLFYLLLRFQAIALGDVGDLDVPLGKDTQRAMVFAETASPKRKAKDRTETASFMSAMSSVSTLNLGGWWGTTKVQDPGRYCLPSSGLDPLLTVCMPLAEQMPTSNFSTRPSPSFLP